MKEKPLPGKYGTAIIDPPTDIQQRGSYGAARHYPLMGMKELRRLPVDGLMGENAHIWVWSTAAALHETYHLIRDGWHFTPRSLFVYMKLYLGLGYYLRNCCEFLIFATRGKAPVRFRGQPNYGFFPRQDHSHKPEELYAIVRRVSPPPYAELFARRKDANNADFAVWGNEIPSDIVLPGFPVPRYSGSVIENTAELRNCKTRGEAERKIWELEHPGGDFRTAKPEDIPRLVDFPKPKKPKLGGCEEPEAFKEEDDNGKEAA